MSIERLQTAYPTIKYVANITQRGVNKPTWKEKLY